MVVRSFITLDDPSETTGTNLFGINDAGQIVGYYGGSDGYAHGFVFYGGNYTVFSDPAATFDTDLYGINSLGQFVGSYSVSTPKLHGTFGFLYSNGVFTTLNDPQGTFLTVANGINILGQIVGDFVGTSGNVQGFLYDKGVYTTIDDPFGKGTRLNGINKSGEIVGNYFDASGLEHGFTYEAGVFTTLVDSDISGTIFASGINDSGEIVGDFTGSNGHSEGFILLNGVYTPINDPLGVNGTIAEGINNSGQVVGYYVDSGNSQHGFVSTANRIFTSKDDVVDFNNLTLSQQGAIQTDPSSIYNGLGGDDVVTLPSAANFNESIGGGETLNWSSSSQFITGSRQGDKYTLIGSDGSYDILLGSGADNVTITGDAISTIQVGAGPASITLSGSGDNIDFSGTGQTATLSLTAGASENIGDFISGDVLKIYGVNLTMFATSKYSSQSISWISPSSPPMAPNTAYIYSGSELLYTFSFSSSAHGEYLNFSDIGNNQYQISVDNNPNVIPDPQEYAVSIEFSFVHQNERLYLAPYLTVNSQNANPGVTIGYGVDLGVGPLSAASTFDSALAGYDIAEEPNLEFLEESLKDTVVKKDKNGQVIGSGGAIEDLQTGQTYYSGITVFNLVSASVAITLQQAFALTKYAETETVQNLLSDWSYYSSVAFSTLPTQIQTVLFDLYYSVGRFGLSQNSQKENLWVDFLAAGRAWNMRASNYAPFNDAILAVDVDLSRLKSPDPSRRNREVGLLTPLFQFTGIEASQVPQAGANSPTTYLVAASSLTSVTTIDPFGHGTYVLTTAAGSPAISTLTLPTSAANAYAVSFEQSGGTWSPTETVQALQTVTVPTGTSSIQVQMLNADGSVDTNPSDLTFDVTFASSGTADVTVTAPTPSSIASTSPLYVSGFHASQTGEVAAGATVTLTLAMSEAVTVNTSGGSPSLALDDGETATYDANASTPANGTLVFDYTVAAGDSSPNLYVTEVDLNGATITDASGNAADFSNALNTPTGLQSGAAVISSIQASAVTTDATTGQTLQLIVGMSEGLTLDTSGGLPTLILSDGATAIYDTTASSPTSGNLVFDYTVGLFDYVVGLTATALNLNGSTLTDSNEIAANLSAANGFGLGFDVNAAIVNTVTPSQTGEVSVAAAVTLTLAMNEPVVVNTTGGLPTLTLNDGATATYDANASKPATGALVFDYVVGASDQSPNLEITQVNLNGETINDANGNAADFDDALYASTGLQVGPAFISSVQGPSAVTDAVAGQTLQLNVFFSHALTLNTSGGSPTLSLSDGATATYDATASSPTSGNLVFDYTVGSFDYAVGLTTTALNLNGATLTDSDGIAADLSAANGFGLGFDVNAAVVNTVMASQTGAVATGAALTLTLAMNEAVAVNTTGGSPTLTLNDGATATYDAQTSNTADGALVFEYTVGSADETSDLEITQVNLNGATIDDGNGNAADFANALFAPTGVVVNSTQGVPCFCTGTRILTDRGEVAVEALAVGDLAATVSGALRPIVWIGHRKIDISRHPDPVAVRPVRVLAGAFGEGLPRRDLWLSPGHNFPSEGALMPISALINGVSVAQIEQDSVEYWHVELDAHDIILAEGLPAESYLDCGNRTGFANGGAFIEAHPDFAPKHWAETCLPLAKEGPAVAATKARLLARLAERGCGVNQEADPHVLIDGLRVEPIRLSERRLAFAVPSDGREIALRSRDFVAAHTVARSTDPRALGLCVSALQIDGSAIDLASDAAGASGWHAPEFDGGRFTHRWTTGSTPLPAGARIVIVDLAGAGHYWSETRDKVVALFA